MYKQHLFWLACLVSLVLCVPKRRREQRKRRPHHHHQVVQPACLILESLAGDTFPLVQYDFVDLVYTLLEMAASRLVGPLVFAC